MSPIFLKQLTPNRRELGYGLQLFALGLVLGAANGRTVGQHWFLAVILCLMLVGGWMIRSQAHE